MLLVQVRTSKTEFCFVVFEEVDEQTNSGCCCRCLFSLKNTLGFIMQPRLFYLNGILEGLFGILVFLIPEAPIKSAIESPIHEDGLYYSGLFSPMFITAGFVSILMAKQPDDRAKQLFCVIWMVYHINAVIRTATKMVEEPKKGIVAIHAFHNFMTLWFAYYLKQTRFTLSSLSPF